MATQTIRMITTAQGYKGIKTSENEVAFVNYDTSMTKVASSGLEVEHVNFQTGEIKLKAQPSPAISAGDVVLIKQEADFKFTASTRDIDLTGCVLVKEVKTGNIIVVADGFELFEVNQHLAQQNVTAQKIKVIKADLVVVPANNQSIVPPKGTPVVKEFEYTTGDGKDFYEDGTEWSDLTFKVHDNPYRAFEQHVLKLQKPGYSGKIYAVVRVGAWRRLFQVGKPSAPDSDAAGEKTLVEREYTLKTSRHINSFLLPEETTTVSS